MTPIEQYKRRGLAHPIKIRPSLKMHMLVWGGGPLLLGGSVMMLLSSELMTQLIGLLGLIFFGSAIIIIASAVISSRQKGLVEFSQDGLWLSTLRTTLPWQSIGPAWIHTTAHEGGTTNDVVFIAKGVDRYSSELSLIPRIHLKLMKRTLKVGTGGVIDAGLEVLFELLGNEEAFDELSDQMADARDAAQHDQTAILLNIPVPFRLGIDPKELVAIINSEHSKYIKQPKSPRFRQI